MMKAEDIKTLNDATDFVEGVINDFEHGISSKAETLKSLGEYTGALMQLFLKNYKKIES